MQQVESKLLNRVPKEFRDVVRPYVRMGVLKLESGSRHLKLRWSNGRMTTVPGSPSDYRAILNFRSELRRCAIKFS